MSNPSEELARLIERLNDDQITPEQFERESAKLIESLGSGTNEVSVDPVRREQIDTAASIVRNL